MGQGNFVEVRAGGLYYRVMHLREELVTPGMTITRGQAIGRSGNTGQSNGPHVHLEAYRSTATRSETAFSALCLYSNDFVSRLHFASTGNCQRYLENGVFSLNSPAYRQQCEAVPEGGRS